MQRSGSTDSKKPAPSRFDHDRFKNIASGIQSLIAAAALGVAGVWVVYSFVALKSEQKAKAEIASLEFSARQEPVHRANLALAPSRHERQGRLLVH